MPSQEYAPPEDATLSQTGSGRVNKRKAPEDDFASDEEVFCPCNVGPCILLTSTKPHSQGRKFYRCPKSKEDGQCGFFQWQDQPPKKQQNQGISSIGGQQNCKTEADGNLQGPQTPECRCGLEAVEITSNSTANPGRVFYKCPKNEEKKSSVTGMHPNTNSSCMTQAEGRCKFFKWQDELLNSQAPPQQPALGLGPQTAHPPASNSQAAPSAVAGGSGVFADGDDDFDNNFGLDEALNNATADKAAAAPNSYGASPFHPGGGQQGYEGQRNSAQQQGFGGQQAGGAQPTSPGAQPPEILNCECSLQCSYIMAKTAKNDGRWFYRCPKPKEEGQCRFFQWADELGQQPPSAGRGGGHARPGASSAPYGAPVPSYHTYSSPTKMGAGGAAASTDACFKCGQTGHWSRDCPSGGGGGGGTTAGGGSCFKCGQEGHWARDCPNPGSGGRAGGGGGRGGSGGGRAYGGAARGYGGAQGYGGAPAGGAGAAPGACYKCGQSGHWTNSCPN